MHCSGELMSLGECGYNIKSSSTISMNLTKFGGIQKRKNVPDAMIEWRTFFKSESKNHILIYFFLYIILL